MDTETTATVSRIELFRQLKSTIKGSKDILIVGIDVSKQYSVACIIDASGEIHLKKFRFDNTIAGATEITNKAHMLKQTLPKKEIVWALEPTGNYHKPLADFLLRQGAMLVGVSTVAAKENRKSLDGRWKKNDPKDAHNVADLVSQGKMFFYNQSPQVKTIKHLLKLRQRIAAELSAIKARLRNNHFALFFPELDSLYADITHPEVLLLLEYFPTAEDIRTLSFDQFQNVFAAKTRSPQGRQRLAEIWRRAQNSIACAKIPSVDIEIPQTLESISLFKKQLAAIEKHITHLCAQDDAYRALQQIPGFGPIISATVLATIGSIQNFTKASQLTKLVGLDLEYIQSGKFHSAAKVSKKGDSLLRYKICSAAIYALKNKRIRSLADQYFLRKDPTPQNKAKFRIKLADKLLRTAFTLLKYNRSFDMDTFLNPVKIACV